MYRDGSASPLRSKSRSRTSQSPRGDARIPSGILRHKSPTTSAYSRPARAFNQDLELSPMRPDPIRESSPLRQKSPAARSKSPSRYEIDPPTNRKSNRDLRASYHRQINLSKKGALNYYETSLFVGYLLDLINLSKKLENLKHRLIQNQDEFNLLDAFAVLVSTVEYDKYN